MMTLGFLSASYPVDWGTVVLAAVIAGIVIAAITVVAVVLSYHRKNRSPSYPLDEFTKLALTENTDRFLYTRTTSRTINNGKK